MMRVMTKLSNLKLITNGTNVIYANGRANRAALIAGDVVTGADIVKGYQGSPKQNAKTISVDVILVSLTTLLLVISEILHLVSGSC